MTRDAVSEREREREVPVAGVRCNRSAMLPPGKPLGKTTCIHTHRHIDCTLFSSLFLAPSNANTRSQPHMHADTYAHLHDWGAAFASFIMQVQQRDSSSGRSISSERERERAKAKG